MIQRLSCVFSVSLNISIGNRQRDAEHEHLIGVGQSELMWRALLLADPAVLPIERRPPKHPVSGADAGRGAEAVYRFGERCVDAHDLLLAGTVLGNGCIVKHDPHDCSSRRISS